MAEHESFGWIFLHLPHVPRCGWSVGGFGGSFLDRWSLLTLCTASAPASIDFICDCDSSYVRAMSTALSRVSSFPSLTNNFSRILQEFVQFQKQFCHGSSRRVPWRNNLSPEASGPLRTVLPFLILLVLFYETCSGKIAFRFHMIRRSLEIRLELLFIVTVTSVTSIQVLAMSRPFSSHHISK